MKRLLAVLVLLWCVIALPVLAQSPDDQYIRIYGLMQQADAFKKAGQNSDALATYLEAQSSLQRLQKIFPEFSPKVVDFRLKYFEERIAALTPRTAPPPSTKLEAAVSLGARPTVAEADQKLMDLTTQVQQLQTDKTILEAKLKEALATQPASIDPRELTKAGEKIQSLMKENDLLKVALNSQQGSPTADQKSLDEARKALEETRQKLAQQNDRANALALEREALQKRLDTLAGGSSAELKTTKAALEASNSKLTEQTELANTLAIEKNSLQTRLDTLSESAAAADALREENELLKKQVAEFKASPASTDQLALQQKQLTQAQAGIAALQSELEILRLEKTALQEQVKKASAPRDEDAKQIAQLQKERDDLQKKLDAAPTGGFLFWRSKSTNTKIKELTDQVDSYRARLEALESKAVPYTPEELAMLQSPGEAPLARPAAVQPAAKPAGNAVSKDPPPGTAALASEAQRYFMAHDMEKAEQKYLEILKQGPDNVYTLANLAAIQMEMGHLDDAEKNIKHALAVAPDDAYSLSILGYLKFRQEDYDAAITALSRAAILEPQNAEIQNYLGVALSHKGMREAAESALRKAIQIDPNYGSAQNNLAVYYATQQPPLLGLARWHYNKAIASGHPRNDELEKLLGTTSPNAAPVAP
jgi:Flp pilus assembly protein TadD